MTWVRHAAFVAIALYLQLGGLFRQVLHVPGPLPLFAADWQMYSGVGRSVCQVEWLQQGPDGVLSWLDPAAVHDPAKLRTFRLRESEDEVRAQAALLCRRAKVDVRARARCGNPTDGSWVWVLDPSERLCDPARPVPR